MNLDNDATQVPPQSTGPAVTSLAAGHTFGQYKILGLLGRGAMGEVYAVRHEVLGTDYAVKLIHPEIAARADMKQRFRDEAKVMARLRHSGIVQVDDFGETEGKTWLRMELVGGESEKGKVGSEKGSSLADYLKARGGKLPEGEVAEIVRQILEALAYAHAQGVVHRDLKPANILLSDKSDWSDKSDRLTIKIADFGLVSLAGDQWLQTQVQQTVARSMVLSGAETVVRSGTGMGSADKALLGTYAYMSPEQKRGEVVDQRSDLYAVGLMAYQMLTGLESIGMRRPSELNNEVNGAWDEWILQATEADRDARFGSAAEMLRHLPQAGKTAAVAAESAPTAAVAPRVAKGRFGWVTLLFTVVAALLIAAFSVRDRWLAFVDAGAGTEPVQVGVVSVETSAGVSDVSDSLVLLRLDPAVSGARVWFGEHSDVAVGADGILEFKDVAAGDYEVVIQAPGYQPVVTRVEVGASGHEQTFRLVPLRGSLSVRTSPGAEVVAIDGDGRETRLGVADREGRLLSENVLRIGEYRIRLSAERRTPQEVATSLMIGRTVQVEGVLSALPGEIRVLTVPVGAKVEASAGDWRERGTTPLTLRGVPAEREISLSASLRGYRTERRTLTLSAAETRTLNLGTLVAESGGLELRIENEELRMGEGLTVKIDGEEMSGIWRNGVLLLEGLEVGRRTLEVSHMSYRAYTTAIEIQDQRTPEHRVRLQPLPGLLTLQVTGPSSGEWTVEVNGTAVTPASGNVLELAAGQAQRIRVSARGWQAAEHTVTLGAAERRTLSVRLEQARGPVVGQNVEVELPGGVKLDMVWIAPGEFTMGSPNNESGRWDVEGPQTRVRLTKGFWLGKYPVTQGHWQALMGNNPSRFKNSGLNAPVESVSWNEAMEFARKLTEQERRAGRLPEGYVYTLPSEAQWEYAARAGTTTRFYTGNSDSDLGRAGWFHGNAGDSTKPVGQKVPNAWGLYDMHGNVWEWTRTWFGNYPGGSVVDYEGPNSGSSRVHRGGSWNYSARHCRSAYRNRNSPALRYNFLGFRLALSSVQ